MGNRNESSAQDMGEFIQVCDEIKDKTGATVLIVHHTGKDGATARGSYSLTAAVDFQIKTTRQGQSLIYGFKV